jgi:lipopolysaccharide transport system permease protein
MNASMSKPRTVIEPNAPLANVLVELWAYRELLLFFAWRDVLIRYKQTAVGIVWAVLRPLLNVAVLTIVFRKIAGMPADGAPYPILVFAALLPWQMFATLLSESSACVVGSTDLISKVYFPRIVLPLTAVLAALSNFLIALTVFGFVLAWYQICPGWQLFLLPLFVTLALGCALGAGLWLSALNVRFRDFGYVLPFILQFGLYLSPVGFTSNMVPERWRLIYSLNPIVGVIDGFRYCLTAGNCELYWPAVLLSCVITVTLLWTGAWFFRRMERTFADQI